MTTQAPVDNDSRPTGTTQVSSRTRTAPERARTPRRPREFTDFDVWILIGSLVSSLCLNWLIFYRFTVGASPFGFVLGNRLRR